MIKGGANPIDQWMMKLKNNKNPGDTWFGYRRLDEDGDDIGMPVDGGGGSVHFFGKTMLSTRTAAGMRPFGEKSRPLNQQASYRKLNLYHGFVIHKI
jgi:hypothetical protein